MSTCAMIRTREAYRKNRPWWLIPLPAAVAWHPCTFPACAAFAASVASSSWCSSGCSPSSWRPNFWSSPAPCARTPSPGYALVSRSTTRGSAGSHPETTRRGCGIRAFAATRRRPASRSRSRRTSRPGRFVVSLKSEWRVPRRIVESYKGLEGRIASPGPIVVRRFLSLSGKKWSEPSSFG